jgi:transcriptional regulator with XRE-family HTH domain
MLSDMQELSFAMPVLMKSCGYDADMQKTERPPLARRLVELRQALGLSQAQLAEKIGVNASNIAFWELKGTAPRGEVLPALAQALRVSVDELLGVKLPKPKRAVAKGRLQLMFESASKLPRRQQEKILDILEPFVRQHDTGQSKAA